MFGSVAIHHTYAKQESSHQGSKSKHQETNRHELFLRNHHRQTLSILQERVDVDTVEFEESVKPPLKLHFNATNVNFVVPDERYRWSKLMTHVVEATDSDELKTSPIYISINTSEITNHSHAVHAIMDFFSLDDMDVYLNTPNFVEKINEDNGVKLALSTIYINHPTIEVR